MSDFLLEIFSEEIPAVMQKSAAENFAKIAAETLSKSGLIFDASQLKSFVTPRRLTLYIYNLQSFQQVPAVRKIGPKIDADKRAIEGFLKSVGASATSQLEQVDNGGKICYAYTKAEEKIKTSEIIKNSLPQLL